MYKRSKYFPITRGCNYYVHLGADNQEQLTEALEEAFETYLHANTIALDNKIPLTPVDSE